MDLLSEFLAFAGPALRWIWIYGSDSKCQQVAVQLAKWCPNVQSWFAPFLAVAEVGMTLCLFSRKRFRN
jgi:hypothetical protein